MKDLRSIKNYRIVYLLIVSLFFFGKANACDLCSCTTSGGNSSFGDLSMSNFIGLRYIHQTFESKNGIFSNSPTSQESFDTYQIWGRIPLNKKLFLSAVVPYQNFTREFEGAKENIKGLGDINIMGWYQIQFYKKQSEEEVRLGASKKLSNHSLNIGLGLKLPTGEFEQELSDNINPGFQVGTGSLDLIASVAHGYKKNNFGLVSSLSYYMKSENKNNYQFGNQFSVSTNLYMSLQKKETLIKPFVGLSGDLYSGIKQYGEEIVDSDGSMFNGSVGSEFVKGNYLLGLKYTLPIKQDLFGGDVKSKNQIAMYFNYTL
jgi:hypothetical protein